MPDKSNDTSVSNRDTFINEIGKDIKIIGDKLNNELTIFFCINEDGVGMIPVLPNKYENHTDQQKDTVVINGLINFFSLVAIEILGIDESELHKFLDEQHKKKEEAEGESEVSD